MTSIITLRKRWQNLKVFTLIMAFLKLNLLSCDLAESNIRTSVFNLLLHLLNSLRKSDKMLEKTRMLSLFLD